MFIKLEFGLTSEKQFHRELSKRIIEKVVEIMYLANDGTTSVYAVFRLNL